MEDLENIRFDDGFDYLILDKLTGKQLARFSDQTKVLPYAYARGRDTVTIKKVNRKEDKRMNKSVNETNSTFINLSEMKIEKVKEDLLLPKTQNPEKEAKELTDETGIYHYAVDDDLTGKQAIVRTNVKALNEEEWISKSFYTADKDVIEPNDFEKNDQYDVSSVDQVAEGYDRNKWEAGYEAFENGHPCPEDPAEKDGWMEAKKEHRKAGQMDEADETENSNPDWREAAVGLYKHNFLPLAYDDNSGQVVLYDISDASSLDDAETVGVFDSTDEMNTWIKSNINESLAEEYRQLAEAAIRTAEQGVDNSIGSEYGPAPTEDQNEIHFDKNGKFVVEAKFTPKPSSFESYVDLPEQEDVEVEVHYDVEESDPSVGYQGGVIVTGVVIKGTEDDIQDSLNQSTMMRLQQEAEEKATDQFADYGDYMYDKMRDERMERDFGEGLEEDSMNDIEDTAKDYASDNIDDHVDEGKSWKYDPDADDDDYDRQDRIKGRQRDKDNRRKEVDEAEGDSFKKGDIVHINAPESNAHDEYGVIDDVEDGIYKVTLYGMGFFSYYDASQLTLASEEEARKHYAQPSPIKEADTNSRLYVLALSLKPESIQIVHKGMVDFDSAVEIAANGGSTENLKTELQVGGVPAVEVAKGEDDYLVTVLDSNLRDAIESAINTDIVVEYLNEMEISEDVFYGFVIQGRTGDVMDDSVELAEEDEMFESPEFVVSSEHLDSGEMAQDPTFVNVMQEAYLAIAEKYGERVETFNPDLKQVDEVIELGIENYPNGRRYSFMMNDPMARDAINAAFGILWDEGKVGPENLD